MDAGSGCGAQVPGARSGFRESDLPFTKKKSFTELTLVN